MYYFLLTILILDAFLLMVVVLLQAGKGGGLAAMGGGGGDTLLGGRQAVTLLTKATWCTGGIFLTLSLALSMMSRGVVNTDPILRGDAPGRAAPTTPAIPGIGESTQPAGGQLTPGLPPGEATPAAPGTAP